ncbi:putative flagellar rod assembly protein FlgJ [Campylobacter lari]|uniref:rod-binding protein n=1 Tax=Campylobacter lari TaxID=201 RepID=UPI0021532850|nr:rod-binding protein [Campylobacter lari]MCR6529272.1 rod-binding protein [Campylobacter lari]MCR6566039.1 rod-binding protein [Campylobacter lari]
MRVDNHLASKNYSSELYESITKHNNSYKAAKNYADSAFKNDLTHIQALNDEDKALKEQTDAFEAFLIKSVLDISLKQENSLFGKDASDEIYSSMYNDTMSKALSGGLGFSKLLFDYLKERG